MKKLLNKTTFIVGNKKNSGKTTFLDAALAGLRGKGMLAYLSIGVDGEMSDQIFGFPKPRVNAEPGDYVVTLDHALSYTLAKFKILKIFPFKTVLGLPMLVKITGPGDIEIIGPENNTQLAEILKYLHGWMRIKTILIDGAINRITQVASFKDAQFVFVCRVDPERVASAAEELKRMIELSRVPCHCERSEAISRKQFCSGDRHVGLWPPRDDMLCLPGALTPAKAAKFEVDSLKKGDSSPKRKGLFPVVVEDFTKVFLNYKELVKFQRHHKLYFQFAFKLAHIVVNLFGVEKKEFLRCVGEKVGKMTVNEI